MKFSFTKNPESEFFIKNPNLTKKSIAGGRGSKSSKLGAYQ